MTPCRVLEILRELQQEAQRLESMDGAAWLGEAIRTIKHEWEHEIEEEAQDHALHRQPNR